jgi:hypothetical protein
VSHSDTYVIVPRSAVAAANSNSTSLAHDPPDAAAKLAASRATPLAPVASFAVPVSPGSPVCSATYGCATASETLFRTASRTLFSR